MTHQGGVHQPFPLSSQPRHKTTQIQLSWQSTIVQTRIILGKSNQSSWPILINVVKKCEVQQDIKLRYMLPVSTFAHIQNTEEKIFDNRKQEINETFLWMWKDDEAKLGQIKEHFWNLGCGTSKKIMSTRKLNHLMSDLDVITIFKGYYRCIKYFECSEWTTFDRK